MWCYIKKRIDILKPKLLVTHPHPEELNGTQSSEFQLANIVLFLRTSFKKVF